MSSPLSQSGLTLVEVLVTTVLLAILLVPAMRALQTGVTGTNVHGELATQQLRLTSRMEELLAQPFANLEVAAVSAGGPAVETTYSDSPGPPGRLIVYLSPFDGDNIDTDDNPFTGTDAGLLWVQVEVENTSYSLQTVVTRTF